MPSPRRQVFEATLLGELALLASARTVGVAAAGAGVVTALSELALRHEAYSGVDAIVKVRCGASVVCAHLHSPPSCPLPSCVWFVHCGSLPSRNAQPR
jgi:hypothetical protein